MMPEASVYVTRKYNTAIALGFRYVKSFLVLGVEVLDDRLQIWLDMLVLGYWYFFG